MSWDFAGKAAIVTGASSGIGEAAARMLAAKGCRLVLAARRADRLEAVAEAARHAGAECVALPGDVAVEAFNQRLVATAQERFGTLDILLLNAGRGNMTSIEDTDAATLHSIFAVNVFALYYAARAALPIMKRQRSGRIVTIASVAGKLGLPYMNAYVAAKHAAIGFSNALRLELLGTGVEATAICPAGVMTEWPAVTEGGPLLALFQQSFQRAREIARERGIKGRGAGLLTAEEIARAVLSAIENPVPEVFTHEGTREEFLIAAADRAQGERLALPMALAMQEAYPRVKGR